MQSNQLCRKLFRAQSLLWSFALKQSKDRTILLENIDRMQRRIDKLKMDQKTMVIAIESLRLTIADMNEKERNLIDITIKKQLDKNLKNTVMLTKVMQLIEAEDLNDEVERSDALDNLNNVKTIIELVTQIKENIEDTEIIDHLKNKFENNTEIMQKRVGWEDVDGLTWSQEPVLEYNKTMAEDDYKFKTLKVEEGMSLDEMSDKFVSIMNDNLDNMDGSSLATDEVSIISSYFLLYYPQY